ncbi:hypothetical protein PGT21_034307 [Puccinia graminis f. sp. tritici]|uniref:Uncharacterized protein n=2 Tax=Puccinia graminis f. sp. tritici TaxID=56615 RepID=E3L1M6_PUCGT|nr:uncharacterized protein PGTG_16038 [Puccinia graminis f. sp. tritici CRL 75-36-700-3]EFP90451.2 hypothetical protein PGTG_16038 [Puccinia graminis f. sp. tritici CRL 75-36-700-3]KAA1101968.1 hypothetical protein PGT21_034307 [Puccinia graminis f. sp. tritici]KAA1133821.1 hypothetical protein PGTUg99_022733 [Puccinia graminis f. sp. tritici]
MKNHNLYLILLTSITLLGSFNSTLADGIFNNIENAKLIQSSSIVPTDGNYVFKNVGTGQTIQHDRKNDVPNIYTSGDGGDSGSILPAAHHHRHHRARGGKHDDDDDDSLEVVSALELRSHRTRTKWISIRTTATTGDPKCISAQWGYHTEGGADHAGTLYECVVDPLNLEATLEKPKQWWLLMPVEAAKNLNSDQTLDLKNQILSQNKHMKMKDNPIISRIVEDQGKASGDQLPTPFWNPKTNRIENFSSPDKPKSKRHYDLSGERKRELENSLPTSHIANTTNAMPVAQALNVVHGDPNHNQDLIEKAEDFSHADASPLKMFDKRTTRHHIYSKTASQIHPKRKEADGSLGPFYVVSVDHLYDMETRVWTSAVKKTVGNQLSLVLKKLDPNDKTQQWYLDVQA